MSGKNGGRGAMSVIEGPAAELTPMELRDLRRLAGFMVPASAQYGVPGADDEAIFADILRSLGCDRMDSAEQIRAYLGTQFGMPVRPNHLGMALQRHRRGR
jgi:hypothetical protein